MIGIIVQLLLSWIIVWFFEKGNLRFLGFMPTTKRLLDFTLFFLLTAICCAMGFLVKMLLFKQVWTSNPALSWSLVLEGAWWNIKAVLFEELIFRGVLFYILIRRLGVVKAIAISAIAFGIYHWFSQEAFGDWVRMAILFFGSGAFGFLLCYGYIKTNTLYTPIAIHLGWNMTQQLLFSNSPIGNLIFISSGYSEKVTVSYFTYYAVTFGPLLLTLFMVYYFLRRSANGTAMIKASN